MSASGVGPPKDGHCSTADPPAAPTSGAVWSVVGEGETGLNSIPAGQMGPSPAKSAAARSTAYGATQEAAAEPAGPSPRDLALASALAPDRDTVAAAIPGAFHRTKAFRAAASRFRRC